MYNKEDVGIRLKKFRESLKITQASISEQLDIPQSTYSKYELGKLDVNMQSLENIQKLHNLNINWLLFGQGEMYLNSTMSNSAHEPEAEYKVTSKKADCECESIIKAQEIKIAQLQAQVELLKELLHNKS